MNTTQHRALSNSVRGRSRLAAVVLSVAMALSAFSFESVIMPQEAAASPFRCEAVARLNYGSGQLIQRSRRVVQRPYARPACDLAMQQCRNFLNQRLQQGYPVQSARCGVVRTINLGS